MTAADEPAPWMGVRGTRAETLHALRNSLNAIVVLATKLRSGRGVPEEIAERVLTHAYRMADRIVLLEQAGERPAPPPRNAATDVVAPSVEISAPPEHPDVAPASAPQAGTLIDDKYRLIAEIGRGGMGTVMLARDERLHRDVAIKLINTRSDAQRSSGAAVRKQLLREARAMARVRHPNVAPVFECGEHDGKPYFVMEYFPGTDLADYVHQHGLLRIDEALGIVEQVCRGVSAIHATGAIHRDIKPGNILIGTGHHVAIADLGLASFKDPEGGALNGGGTPGYVAPEIIASEPIENAERVDVYSLGALVYWLLTGAEPFGRHGGNKRILRRQLAGSPVPPSARRPELGEALDGVVLRALARKPGERTESPEILRQELERVRTAMASSYPGVVVLVVDDDAEVCSGTADLVREILPGAVVLESHDGNAALDLATRSPPTVAVVDLDMPGINGIELTATLKSQAETAHIPILVVTGVGGASDWRALHDAGAGGLLLKPVEPTALAALLRKVLATRERDERVPEATSSDQGMTTEHASASGGVDILNP